ncbi:MAG: PASTA domain-containing protein [Thermoleophilia bacterium]|nr:PASTA domain-containing protein [Thermoleophilia bacterium]
MGRLGTFVPRLVALTAVWLLATTALTYAAAQRIGTAPPAPTTTTATTTAAPAVKVVPDVRRQAFVFAKGTLGDSGFGFRIEGSVHGFASNTVVSQSPAPGARVIDTGAPLVVLRLARSGAQTGLPEDVSPVTPTALQLEGGAPARKVARPTRVAKKTVTNTAVPRRVAKRAPAKTPRRRPPNRPPAFVVPGARREPLDEMPLTDRARKLLAWLNRNPQPTDANVRYWLYQHAWIVAGARMGWWHGADALETLVAADRRVWALWGIGARSSSVAREAFAEVTRKSS